MACFLPEHICEQARNMRERFGAKSFGRRLREYSGSMLQWSTTTSGAEHFARPKQRTTKRG